MDCEYIIADACGNTTAFILADLPPRLRSAAAGELLRTLKVEQLGYLHSGRMDMMGGEFCGNASRAFALWQTLGREGPWPRQETVTVSGADRPLTVVLRREQDGCFAAIDMPLPLSVTPFQLGDTPVTRVTFAGITHLVCASRPPREGDMELARSLISADALGLLYVQGDAMRPLVWVRDAGSLCWESSCASGTCAVTAARALELGRTAQVTLCQPGGSLSARACLEGGVLTRLTLDGPVAITGGGTVTL